MTDIVKPIITLRAIKLYKSMSEETACYEASLYVDGELWGRVSNRGQGGADDFAPAKGHSYADLAPLNARIAATYEGYSAEWTDKSLPADLEMICGRLLDDHEAQAELKRIMRAKIVGSVDGKLYTWKLPAGRMPEMKAAIRKKHASVTFLDELPFDKALAVFSREAAL